MSEIHKYSPDPFAFTNKKTALDLAKRTFVCGSPGHLYFNCPFCKISNEVGVCSGDHPTTHKVWATKHTSQATEIASELLSCADNARDKIREREQYRLECWQNWYGPHLPNQDWNERDRAAAPIEQVILVDADALSMRRYGLQNLKSDLIKYQGIEDLPNINYHSDITDYIQYRRDQVKAHVTT